MRQGTRLLISASVLVVTIGAIFLVWKPELIFGQRLSEIPSNRKPACSIFCGDATMNYVVMGEPPACFGGPLPAGDAGNQSKKLKDLPAENRKGYCEYLRAHNPNSSCPVFKTLMTACDMDDKESPDAQPPPETQPSPPAGGSPGDDCKDRQHVRFRRLGKNYVYIACGKVIGRFSENADPSYVKFIESIMPSKDTVCCGTLEGESFECQRDGIDCDNYYPEFDPSVSLQDLLGLHLGDEAPDPLPQGLRRQEILPGSTCDGGKWELMKGNNRCRSKSKSTSLFWYEATWKCPKTGMTVSKASSTNLLRQRCKSSAPRRSR